MIRTIALENKDRCISANTVLPGTMDTPGNRAGDPKADGSQWVQPSQVAATAGASGVGCGRAGHRRRDPGLRQAGVTCRSPLLVRQAADGVRCWSALVFAVAFVDEGIQRVDSVAAARAVGLPPDRAARGRGALAPAAGALVEGGAEECIAMIQPLRRAHFRIWVVLALLLYAVFLAGLLARRSHNAAQSEHFTGSSFDESQLSGGRLESNQEDL